MKYPKRVFVCRRWTDCGCDVWINYTVEENTEPKECCWNKKGICDADRQPCFCKVYVQQKQAEAEEKR